jgi:hypothetical protein
METPSSLLVYSNAKLSFLFWKTLNLPLANTVSFFGARFSSSFYLKALEYLLHKCFPRMVNVSLRKVLYPLLRPQRRSHSLLWAQSGDYDTVPEKLGDNFTNSSALCQDPAGQFLSLQCGWVDHHPELGTTEAVSEESWSWRGKGEDRNFPWKKSWEPHECV